MPAERQSGQRLVMCAPCWLQPGPTQLRVDIVVVVVGRCGLYACVSVCGGSGVCLSVNLSRGNAKSFLLGSLPSLLSSLRCADRPAAA